MNSQVFMQVNGREWGGWSAVSITAGIDRLSRTFSVAITRRWPGNSEDLPPIRFGDAVEVLIDSDPVLTGWVEAVPVNYSSSEMTLNISGRSKTADLVDCSALPVQYSGQTLQGLISALAAPFSVEVIAQGVPDTPVPRVQASHGETVVARINKLLAKVPALVFDDAQGRLILGGAGEERATTALVLGENILAGEASRNVANRFSTYLVSGQSASDDDNFAEATLCAIKHQAVDAEITRFRPTTLNESGDVTRDHCRSRAEYEARMRAAKSRETSYTVQGWRQGSGALWQPNQRVIVWDPLMGFDNEELLIAEVTWAQSLSSGTTAKLRVGPLDAYIPPQAAESAAGGGK